MRRPGAQAGALRCHKQNVARTICRRVRRCGAPRPVRVTSSFPIMQGSYLCGACVPGYFLDFDGTCSACPAVSSVWDKYGTLIVLFLCVLGFALVVFVITSLAVLASESSLSGRLKVNVFGITIHSPSPSSYQNISRPFSLLRSLQSALQLIVYFLTVIQVLSNVSQVNSKRLPRALQSVYRGIALLQLQGVSLPPACVPDGYYFSTEVSLMSVALFFWLSAVVLSAGFWLRRGLLLWRFIRLSMLLALLLHPAISSVALSLVNCQTVLLSRRAIAVLQGGTSTFFSLPGSAASSDSTLVPVLLLASNPYIVCFSTSAHLPAGVLAVITLVVYVAGLPVLTLLWILWDPWLQRHVRPGRRNCGRRRSSVVSHAPTIPAGEVDSVNGPNKLRAILTSSPWNPSDDTPAVLWPFLRDSGCEWRMVEQHFLRI